MSLANIKGAIKTNLDELVTAGTLGGATTTDLKKDPLREDVPSYPHAYLMPPSIDSESLTNRSNLRTYTFDIMVLFRADDISSATDLETDIEAILNKFDNDPTLSGNATGGVSPAASSPQPFQRGDASMIMVVIQIQARAEVSLSFS